MDYSKPTERPAIGKFLKFDHIKFHVGNAKQAAAAARRAAREADLDLQNYGYDAMRISIPV